MAARSDLAAAQEMAFKVKLLCIGVAQSRRFFSAGSGVDNSAPTSNRW